MIAPGRGADHAVRPGQRAHDLGGDPELLRLEPALAVHGPDQPAGRADAQAPPLGARARAASRASAPASRCATCTTRTTAACARSRRRKARTSASSRRSRPTRGSTSSGSSRRRTAGSQSGVVDRKKIEFLAADDEDQLHHRAGERAGRRASGKLLARHADRARSAASSRSWTPSDVEYMDVSPNQLVSARRRRSSRSSSTTTPTARSWARNMQRQAVPLLRTEAPLVGTGLEDKVARGLGRAGARASARAWSSSSRARRSLVRYEREPDETRRSTTREHAGHRHLPADQVPPLEPGHLHQPAAGRRRRARR